MSVGDDERRQAKDFLDRQVEAAVQPFVGVLDEEQLNWMRTRLQHQLAADPTLHELIEAAMPRQVNISGERLKSWLLDEAEGLPQGLSPLASLDKAGSQK